MIMEADKSQDLQLVSWRPKRADGVAPVWVQSQGKKIDASAQIRSGRKNPLLLMGGSAFLFYSGLQLIGCGPPTLGRATCFIQSTDLNVNVIQSNSYTIMFDQISMHPISQSSWQIKLSIKNIV